MKKACAAEGLGLTQATFSWLLHNSALTEADGVLLGASKLEHLEQNIECCAAAAPLSAGICT